MFITPALSVDSRESIVNPHPPLFCPSRSRPSRRMLGGNREYKDDLCRAHFRFVALDLSTLVHT